VEKSNMTRDKQLIGVELSQVIEKRRLDQALNAKEFAVLAGISYSAARAWFRLPGFPAFLGVVFWDDFVRWRNARTGQRNAVEVAASTPEQKQSLAASSVIRYTGKAAQILAEAG
jgi:hypothetical protein